jgi:GH18 family chitinase
VSPVKFELGFYIPEDDILHSIARARFGVGCVSNCASSPSPAPAHCTKLLSAVLSQSDGLRLWEEMGCPPHKLVLGVPFYGHVYVLSANSTSYEPGTAIAKDAKVTGGMPYHQV